MMEIATVLSEEGGPFEDMELELLNGQQLVLEKLHRLVPLPVSAACLHCHNAAVHSWRGVDCSAPPPGSPLSLCLQCLAASARPAGQPAWPLMSHPKDLYLERYSASSLILASWAMIPLTPYSISSKTERINGDFIKISLNPLRSLPKSFRFRE